MQAQHRVRINGGGGGGVGGKIPRHNQKPARENANSIFAHDLDLQQYTRRASVGWAPRSFVDTTCPQPAADLTATPARPVASPHLRALVERPSLWLVFYLLHLRATRSIGHIVVK